MRKYTNLDCLRLLYMEPAVANSWKKHMKLGKKARELQSVAKEWHTKQ